MKNQLKHSESGRTMLEMLGVLGIMGVIMYGAVAGINYGMSTYKINQTYNEVQEAMQAIQDLYSWQRCYPDNVFTGIVQDNDILLNGAKIGTVSVAGIGASCNSGVESFKLEYSEVSEAIVSRLAEMEWGDTIAIGAGSTITFCPRRNPAQTTCS